MHASSAFRFVALAFCAVFVLSAWSGCHHNDCEDVICTPCPSSRLIIQYQDSTGRCDADFHAGTWIYALNREDHSDTLYRYNFSDSCQAAFLLQEDAFFKVVSPVHEDFIQVESYTYQEPLEITECCLCYPVATAEVNINGDVQTVTFTTGEYTNPAMVITVE